MCEFLFILFIFTLLNLTNLRKDSGKERKGILSSHRLIADKTILRGLQFEMTRIICKKGRVMLKKVNCSNGP